MTPPLTPVPRDPASRLERPAGRRAALLAALLLLPPIAAWWLGPLLGLAGGSRGLVTAGFVAVLLIGYQLWWLRILVFVTGAFGRRLQRGAWPLLRQRTPSVATPGIRPSAEETEALELRALGAAGIFRTVARSAGVVVGIVTGFTAGWGAAAVALVALICWGQLLASLGRAGWLPIPEPE